MPKQDRKPSKNLWKTLILANALGIDFVVCVLAGFFLGSYAERLTGQILWMVAGLLLGIAAGIWSVIFIVKRYMEGSDE